MSIVPLSTRAKRRKASQHRTLRLEHLERRELLATFQVSSLAASGPGTLRQAILNANGAAGADTITFSVTGIIRPTTALPEVTDVTSIDGTSAPGFSDRPRVAIDGALAGEAHGLVLRSDGSTVTGLAIHGFKNGAGLVIAGSSNIVAGNFIGMDLNGITARPNEWGIIISPMADFADVAHNIIGGTTTGARNVISGNNRDGLAIRAGHHNEILGNFIGVDVSGVKAIGNRGNGIIVNRFSPFVFGRVPFDAGNGNELGGTEPGEGNRIRGNWRAGVAITDGRSNPIRGNDIDVNKGLGIDLAGPGFDNNAGYQPEVTQNVPIVGGIVVATQSTQARGLLQSLPDTTYTIDVYASPTRHISGRGQGRVYLGATTVTTNGQGVANWLVTATRSVNSGWYISATATDPSSNTSDFSNAAEVPPLGAPATVQFLEAAPRFRESAGMVDGTCLPSRGWQEQGVWGLSEAL